MLPHIIWFSLKALACLCFQSDKYTYAYILDSNEIDLSNTPDNDEVLVKLHFLIKKLAISLK